MIFRENKEYEKAIGELEKARELHEETGYMMGITRSYYEQGLILINQNETKKAVEFLEKALSEYDRMGMKLWVSRCRKALSGLEE